VQRTHLACGLFPTFANRPVRILTLFIDYFMGECSPIYKELPLQQQTRTSLSSRIAGERLDLVEYFWTFWEVMRSFDTGSPMMAQHPKAVLLNAQAVSLSGTDRMMWDRRDMLSALIKQNYNAHAVAEIYPYWCWENQNQTQLLVPIAGSSFAQAYDWLGLESHWEIVAGLLRLDDSLSSWRVSKLLDGGDRGEGAIQKLRASTVMHPDPTARCLVSLATLLDVPAVLAWFKANVIKWQWIVDFLVREEHAPSRRLYASVGALTLTAAPPAAGASAQTVPPSAGGSGDAGVWHTNPIRRGDSDMSTIEMDNDLEMYQAPTMPGLSAASDAYEDEDDEDDEDVAYQRQRYNGHY